MDNKLFDKNIKQRLESIDSKTPPNDWDQFSQLLNQEEGFEDLSGDNQDFDNVIFDRVKVQTKSFNSSHWILLKNRLEKEASLRKEIYTTKIMESVLVLLLVFTFIHLDNYYQPTQISVETPQLFASNTGHQATDFIDKPIVYKQSGTSVQNRAVSIENPKYNSLNNIESVIANIEITSEELSLVYTPIDIIKLNLFSQTNKDIIVEKDTPNNFIAQLDTNEENIEDREMMDKINLLKSVNEEVKFDLKESYPMFYIKPKVEEKRDIFLTAGVASVFSVISSPGDQTLDLDSYNIYNVDFATGLELSTISNNIELGIGLNYQNVSYAPAKITEITGGFQSPLVENSLDKIQFDLFQVPISFKYHINNTAKTHLYAGVSIGLNLAGFTSYKVTSEEIAPPSAPFGPDREEVFARTILDEKNFHPGALENGSIFDNFYISAIAQVGIEREIDDNLSINASVGYSKSLSYLGLGPNNDIIDAVKLGIGMKYRI